jgi:hypothetical protein
MLEVAASAKAPAPLAPAKTPLAPEQANLMAPSSTSPAAKP